MIHCTHNLITDSWISTGKRQSSLRTSIIHGLLTGLSMSYEQKALQTLENYGLKKKRPRLTQACEAS